MWWAIPAAMAVMGGIGAERKRNSDIANNQMQAEISKYAPWTGQWGQIGNVSGGFLNGAMQGAMSGMGMMQSLNGSGFLDGRKAQTLDVSGGQGPTGWSTLEGSKYLEMPEVGGSYSKAPFRSYFSK